MGKLFLMCNDEANAKTNKSSHYQVLDARDIQVSRLTITKPADTPAELSIATTVHSGGSCEIGKLWDYTYDSKEEAFDCCHGAHGYSIRNDNGVWKCKNGASDEGTGDWDV